MKRYKVIRPASREEWLQERSKGLGSSEIGTILNVNKYDTPFKLWMRKKGYAEPIAENQSMKMGHILEQAVVDCFVDATGAEVVKASHTDWIAVDREKDYLRVSPDRIYYKQGDKHTEANKRILECKTGRIPIDPDNLPKAYWAQVQYQMHVTGIHNATLAWLINGLDFGYVDIEYSENFCLGMMLPALEEFWNVNILGNVEPKLTDVSDVLAKYTHTEGEVEANIDIALKYNMLKDVSKKVSELNKQKEELENEIKLFMVDKEFLNLDGDTLVTWKTSKASAKFDAKRFQAEHPEMAERYMVVSPGTRRFVVK